MYPELTSANKLLKARALATYRCFLLDIEQLDHRNYFINIVAQEINTDTGYGISLYDCMISLDNSPNIILYIECSLCIDAMIMNDDWSQVWVAVYLAIE